MFLIDPSTDGESDEPPPIEQDEQPPSEYLSIEDLIDDLVDDSVDDLVENGLIDLCVSNESSSSKQIESDDEEETSPNYGLVLSYEYDSELKQGNEDLLALDSNCVISDFIDFMISYFLGNISLEDYFIVGNVDMDGESLLIAAFLESCSKRNYYCAS